MGTVHRLCTAPEAVTLSQAVSVYLPTLGAGPKRGIRKVYTGIFGALVAEFGEGTPVDELGPDAVAEWFTGRWGDRSPSRWHVARTALAPAVAY